MLLNPSLPHITSPSWVTSTSQTLTDNIFTKGYDSSYLGGNTITTMSDYQAQFFLLNKYNKSTLHKEALYFQDFTEMEKQKDLINKQTTNKCQLGKRTLHWTKQCQQFNQYTS